MSVLEKLFRSRWAKARIRANPIGVQLERYISYLASRGHSRNTIHQYVFAAEHFGRWLKQRPMSHVLARQFLYQHLKRCRCRRPALCNLRGNRAAVSLLLKMADIVPTCPVRSSGFVIDLLRRYEEGLVTVRGLAASTVRERLANVRFLLRGLHCTRADHLVKWTPECIERLTLEYVRRHGHSANRTFTLSARSFLRFLLQEGLIHRDLASAVPAARAPQQQLPPEPLQPEELTRLLNAADVRTAQGMRDRAMLLCMIELGLRASEVADLELEGLDLTNRLLQMRRRKQREEAALPMTRRLVAAMRAYLRRGRPTCASSTVFVVHRAPRGKRISPVTVSNMVARLASRAGLQERIRGAHVLRHSLASRLLGAGASLKQVADVLGHRCINTTTIYAKVDLGSLSAVALPWPGAEGVQP